MSQVVPPRAVTGDYGMLTKAIMTGGENKRRQRPDGLRLFKCQRSMLVFSDGTG